MSGDKLNKISARSQIQFGNEEGTLGSGTEGFQASKSRLSRFSLVF